MDRICSHTWHKVLCALWAGVFFPHLLLSQLLLDGEDRLRPAFHEGRRAALRALLPEGSAALIFSQPAHRVTSNVYDPYRAQKDIIYLSGHRGPNSLLMVFKEPQVLNIRNEKKPYKALVFAQECKPGMARFEKECKDVDQLRKQLEIEVLSAELFASFSFPEGLQTLFLLPLPRTHPKEPSMAKTSLHALVEQYEEKIKATGINENKKALRGHLNSLREIKTPEEIHLMRRAVYISEQGHIEAMKSAHKAMTERELQGVHEFVHRKYQATTEGYAPIVARGDHGLILHYARGESILGAHLVLMDVGAQYQGYTADITRTIPATGRFSKEQRAIYEAVLKTQKEVIAACTVGTALPVLSQKNMELLGQALIRLGIIKEKKEARYYMPHGVTHHIGLYVHDSYRSAELKEGMIITIEPGLYIPKGSPCAEKWWGIAVRIEDNILITKEGPEVLSTVAPKDPERIERLMRKKSALSRYRPPSFPE